jgi:uncharacterized coiled-coil protein SlyX
MRDLTRKPIAALADRVAGVRQAVGTGRRSRSGPPDASLERRLEAVEVRMQHLEGALEGLQDALYRQSRREDEHVADLRKRTEPDRIARELSADARRRGL